MSSDFNMQNGGRLQQTTFDSVGPQKFDSVGPQKFDITPMTEDELVPAVKQDITPMTEDEAILIINDLYKTLIEKSYEKILEDYKQILKSEPVKTEIPESNINYSEIDYPKVEQICKLMFDRLTQENKDNLNKFLKENKLMDVDFISKIEYYAMLNLGNEQETAEQYFNIKYFFENYGGTIPGRT
jgi:hypothetical protein